MKTVDNLLTAITVIIPVLNEEKNLPRCLDAVVRQKYRPGGIKIMIADGGSKDNTAGIARSYGCRVINNHYKLAEPGIALAMESAETDLCCILAADNIISEADDFFLKMALPFQHDNTAAALPAVISKKDEPYINQYINYRAEPFSEFLYGNACNTRTFHKVYTEIKRTDDYVIYDFSSGDYPLIALAQGMIVNRRVLTRTAKSAYCDMQPVIQLLEQKSAVALVHSAELYHYQIMSTRIFIKKFQWRIRNNLIQPKTPGINTRKDFTRKKYLWFVYSLTFILPLLSSVVSIITHRKVFFIYRFITNQLILLLLPYTYLKVKSGTARETYK